MGLLIPKLMPILMLLCCFIVLSGCSQRALEWTAAGVIAGSAQGVPETGQSPMRSPTRIDRYTYNDEDLTPPLEISIQSPPENSLISPSGFSLSGRCNLNGSSIEIFLNNSRLSSCPCDGGRWDSKNLSGVELPPGRFQIFVKMKGYDGASVQASRVFRN